MNKNFTFKSVKGLRFSNLMAIVLFALLCSTQQIVAQAPGIGNLMVERLGNGSYSLASTAAGVYIDQYNTSGTLVTTDSMPKVKPRPGSAPYNIVETGTSTAVGFPNLSADGKLMSIPGYNDTIGFALGTSSAAPPTGRTLGIINGSRTMTTPTTINMHSGGTFRALISDGTGYWTAGSNGLNYVANSSATTATLLNSTNSRCIQIVRNTLYYSTGSGFHGIYRLGTSGTMPTGTSTAATLVFTASSGSSSPYGFAMNDTIDGSIAYIADDAGSVTTGISKFKKISGTWTFQYYLCTTACRGLAVDFSSTNPVVYATTTATTANTLIKVTDVGTANQTATILATAAANTVFRGMCFAQQNAPIITLANNTTVAPANINTNTVNDSLLTF